MSLALVTFSSKVECSNLCNIIIGIGGNNDIMRLPEWHNFDSVPTLPTLSNEQGNIIQNVMQNHITLIEGFSGSGKTTCLLGIMHYLLKENQGRILVCAPTNQLVDHLALCIQKIEPSVVRFFPMIRHSNTRASSLCVEEKFRDYLPSEFRQLQEQVDRGENISDVDKQRLSKEKVMAKRAAWKNAKVICCTCLSAGNEQLNLMEFGAIIIDDSMQAVEPESIIPISLGCKRLVLVGDELQLKPIIQSEEAEEEGFKETLFERLSTRIPPLRLTKQFRMHPKLWNCIRVNYEDLHETDYGITEDERRLPYADWPNPKYPFKLINCTGSEARVASDEFRFINTTEAQHVAELARDLVKNYHIAPEKIGIITQFNDQAVRVMRKLTELGITGVEVDKMDHFLGREKDIIIVSCVRTSYNESFGSLKYKDRLHLTLTRAKCGLFIVADLRCLYHNSQNEVWRPVLNYYHQHVESLPFLG